VIAAYEGDGLDVSTTAANPGFARLQVTDPTTLSTAKVELDIDWRQRQPVTLTPSGADLAGTWADLVGRGCAVSPAPRVMEAQAAVPRSAFRQGRPQHWSVDVVVVVHLGDDLPRRRP